MEAQSGQQGRCLTGTVVAAGRLDRAVGAISGLSRRHAGKAIVAGGVYVDGRRCRLAGAPVRTGQQLEVWPDAEPVPHDADLEILQDTGGLWIVDKPAGLSTSPPRQGGDSLTDRLSHRFDQPVHASHRIDRDVSGLLAVAKDAETRTALDRALRERTVARGYLALVRTWVAPAAMTISEPLHTQRGRTQIAPWGLPATTHIVPLGFEPGLALVGVRLESGRTHQARAHLAHAIGAIAGDKWYGDVGPKFARVALHAAWLRIPSLAGAPGVTLSREPGPDFWAAGDVSLPADWEAHLTALGSTGGASSAA